MKSYLFLSGASMHPSIMIIQYGALILYLASLLPVALLDFRSRIVPDRWIALCGFAGLGASLLIKIPAGEDAVSALSFNAAGAVICVLPFLLLYFLRKDLGGADVKMALAVGLWAGPLSGIHILLMGSLISLAAFLVCRQFSGFCQRRLAAAAAGDSARTASAKDSAPDASPAVSSPADKNFIWPLLPGVCFSVAVSVLYELLKMASEG